LRKFHKDNIPGTAKSPPMKNTVLGECVIIGPLTAMIAILEDCNKDDKKYNKV
jgi:hypothetical protein